MYNEMSVMLISVSHDTVVSNKHEERTRHYYVIFQQSGLKNENNKVGIVGPHMQSMFKLWSMMLSQMFDNLADR